jgi:hypothetical protein
MTSLRRSCMLLLTAAVPSCGPGRPLAAAVPSYEPGRPLAAAVPAALEARDPAQAQDRDFARAVERWTTRPEFLGPLAGRLPRAPGVPSPKDVLGRHVGAPGALTYYADMLGYYRALARATPRVLVEVIGRSDEGRELAVVWVSSERNIAGLARNREALAALADPRGRAPEELRALILAAKPHYHFAGGQHGDELGPPEMLMELVYRLAADDSPLVRRIRENVVVSVTPAADPDGRDRHVDWARQARELGREDVASPYGGKYVHRDVNRDVQLTQASARALAAWYFTAHPTVVHDIHEMTKPSPLAVYGEPAPAGADMDPSLFEELAAFSAFERARLDAYGMPGVEEAAFANPAYPGYLGSLASMRNGLIRLYEARRGDDGGRFSRRDGVNYTLTAALSAAEHAASAPQGLLENFLRRTENSIASGKSAPPYGFVVPARRDMTRAAELVNVLRAHGVEVGRAEAPLRTADGTFPAGSYVIKCDQPYGRLARILLRPRREGSDPPVHHDDTGWTLGLAMGVDVEEVRDKAVLSAPTAPVERASARGSLAGEGGAGFAVAHFGSNNMIAFRYRLRDVPMRIAADGFRAGGTDFPAGSFLVPPSADPAKLRAAVEDLGLTAAALRAAPDVRTHEADPPRVAVCSSWEGARAAGWVRFALDALGVPYDLIHTERLREGGLRRDYDVVLLPPQHPEKSAARPSDGPVPYRRTESYAFLGAHGESDDVAAGPGAEGAEALAAFLREGGTLIAMGPAAQFVAESGLTAAAAAPPPSPDFRAPRPIVAAEVLRPGHPVFYGYEDRVLPVKYAAMARLDAGAAGRDAVLARYVGGDAAVLSGHMRGADELRGRPLALDAPPRSGGAGRAVLFANAPFALGQSRGEHNMVFNAVLNWNDMGVRTGTAAR